MKVKLGSFSGSAVEAIDDLIQPIYSRPGMRVVGICELAHLKREQIAPGEKGEPSVTVDMKFLEIGRGEQVEYLRNALRALKLQRTARGTLDEELDGAFRLNKSTLAELGDDLALRETARLRAVLEHAKDTTRRLSVGTFEPADIRNQLDKLHRTLRQVLEFAEPDEDAPPALLTASGVLSATSAEAGNQEDKTAGQQGAKTTTAKAAARPAAKKAGTRARKAAAGKAS